MASIPKITNKQILVRPFEEGVPPNESHFRAVTVTEDHPALKPNQLFIKNLCFSMEPLLFYDFSNGAQESKVRGFGMSQVLASTNPAIPVGAIIHITMPWEEYSVISAETGNPMGDVIVHSPADRHVKWGIPLTAYNGILGIPGFTAWDSLRLLGNLKAGEVIYVNSAAGTLGSLAGQIAKRKGLKVIGSAGSQAKLDYLKNTLGFDAVFNYKTTSIRDGLAQSLASIASSLGNKDNVGLDIYFDLVNDVPSLEAVMDCMNHHGRILSVGMIADQLNDKPQTGPKNYMQLLAKQIRWEGYIVMERYSHYHEMLDELEPLVSRGEIKYVEHVIEGGVEDIPSYFCKAQQGAYMGKVNVNIALPKL